MATTSDQEDKATLLKLTSDLFVSLRATDDRKLTAARELVFAPGIHAVKVSSKRIYTNAIGDAFDNVETRWQADPNDSVGHYHRIMSGESGAEQPEVFNYESKMAAVWAPYEKVSVAEDAVVSRGYVIIAFVKPADGEWKVSAFTHNSRADAAALPPVSTQMVPGIERLLRFPNAFLERRSIDIFPDWFVPGARVVRHRVPNEPVGDTVENLVGVMMSMVPVGVDFHEDFEDFSIRIADGMGLVFMKFVSMIGGKPASHGLDILIVVETEQGWRMAGAETYAIPSAPK
jgi:hypothetical protein